MIQRHTKMALGCVIAIGWTTLASAQEIDLLPVREGLQMRDLANVAQAMGLYFEIFDYEANEAHCIHFYVDEEDDTNTRERHDVGGECGLAGPQRLTLQWRREAGSLTFQMMRFRRDIDQGGVVLGPTINIPDPGGMSLYSVKPPKLALGREIELVHTAFGVTPRGRKDFRIIAELRPNPGKVVGTE